LKFIKKRNNYWNTWNLSLIRRKHFYKSKRLSRVGHKGRDESVGLKVKSSRVRPKVELDWPMSSWRSRQAKQGQRSSQVKSDWDERSN